MARPTTRVQLLAEESAVLLGIAEKGGGQARRARIILLLGEGLPGCEVARRTGTAPQTVCAWRQRFLRLRLDALHDAADPIDECQPQRKDDGEAIDAPQPATLQRIADVVGAHKSTVQRVLHRDSRDDSELARRIRIAARDLSYRLEGGVRPVRHRFLRPQDRRRVLVYLSSHTFRAPYFIRQATGLLDEFANTRFDALVRLADDLSQRHLPTGAATGEFAAVVSIDIPDWLGFLQAQVERLPRSSRPPLIGLLTGVPGTWSASVDFQAAGRQAMAHLLDLGHRHLLALDERPSYIAGLREELAARGRDPDESLTVSQVVPGGPGTACRVTETLRRMLERQPRATALLACNDPTALRAIQVFASMGRPVPQAMSVVGFDDTDVLPGTDGGNRLTSLALPLEDLGRAAARLAMDPGPLPRQVLLPTRLNVRGTTGPPG